LKEKEIAIIGCGMHKFGRLADESYADIGREVIRMALQDAGIAWKDIQAAYSSTMYFPATSGARIMHPLGANEIAEAIVSKSPIIIKYIKKAITRGLYSDLAAGLAFEKTQ
jgi:acetyl-CoA acetyltransferase